MTAPAVFFHILRKAVRKNDKLLNTILSGNNPLKGI